MSWRGARVICGSPTPTPCACTGPDIGVPCAIVINDWCIDPNGKIIDRKKKLFIEAYDSIRQLNNSEHEALNSYLRLAAMRFLISRFRDQFNEKDAELNTIKDPLFFYEILKNRRQSLN